MVQSSFNPQSPQNVAVVIRINQGSFAEGFPLLVQILEDGRIIQEHDDLPSTRVEAESLVNYLTKQRQKLQPKVFVFYNSKGLFSPDLLYQFRSVLEAYHGKVIGQPFDLSDQNLNTRNISQEVKKAIEEADALAVLPDGQTKDSTAFKNAIDIINWNNGKKPILGANTLYVQEVLNQPKETIVDTLFLAVDWHPDQCGAKDFRENIRKYWGGDLNRRTTLAYEAVQAVLQTIKPNSPVIRTNDIQNKLSQAGIGTEVAASSDAIKGLLISFNETHDRKELTTRAIATVDFVNKRPQFVLAQDVPCPN